MNHDASELTEAHYELVISVDARRSGEYDDVAKQRMRDRIYRVLETALVHAKVAREAVHIEDRGDGVLLSVPGRISASRLLGLWLVEVHEKLRDENRDLAVPLGLRIGMHVGPVRHDDRGISGRAVDLACRLADSSVARQLLDAEKADLVLVTSQSLYEDVVSGGGKFIEPAQYSSARLELKEGAVTAWFHLPGRPAPEIPVPPSPFSEAVAEAADITADFAGIRPRSRSTAAPTGASARDATLTAVILPALGESATEATVTCWLKAVGDSVEADEPLLQVATDKVDTEIPAPTSGTLLEILVAEDETVEIGASLAVIGARGTAPATPAAPRAPRRPPGDVGIHQNVRRDAFHNENNVYHGTVQMGGAGNHVTEQGKD